jgi:G:T-mismatch repair DNA endonuclease (very short patch repair protein)
MLKSTQCTKECKKKMSLKRNELLKNEKFRNKMMKIWQSETQKEKISNGMDNSVVVEKLRELAVIFNKRPEIKDLSIKRMKKMWEEGKIIMPLKDSKIEIKIQSFLKQLNIEFFTHQYIKDIEHGYQCDIFIPSLNMVIECFGNYWHKYPISREIDILRCCELREKSYKLLVFWENEISVMQLEDFRNKLEEKIYGK